MADGPSVQKAGQRALKAGGSLRRTLQLARRFRESDGETPLMGAARVGRMEAVELVLAAGVDVNAADSFKQETALMRAAAEGHAAVVDRLLAAGANPNLQARVTTLAERKNADYPSGGFSALMWAVRNGHVDIVQRLVAAGADLNLRNGDGAEIRTPMAIAVISGLTCSTVLTLFLIPSIYKLFDGMKDRLLGTSPAETAAGGPAAPGEPLATPDPEAVPS